MNLFECICQLRVVYNMCAGLALGGGCYSDKEDFLSSDLIINDTPLSPTRFLPLSTCVAICREERKRYMSISALAFEETERRARDRCISMIY